VFALTIINVVWGANPTTCGLAFRFTVRNPRLLPRADTALAFIESHTV
jgi:hypothetical protein